MPYYLWAEGYGEGCDYTIGCNLSMTRLAARTHKEAVAEAKRLMGDDEWAELDPDYEQRIESATILSVSKVTDLPLGAWRAEVQAEADAEVEQEKEAQERAEFERLQAKFG